MRSKPVLAIFWIALVLALTGSASPQTTRRNFTRPQTYDAQHYSLRISFDRPAKKVLAETTVRLKPLKAGFTAAEFDAVGINFNSVTLEPAGTALKHRAQSGKISVTLDKAYGPTDEIILKFKHSSVPRKGVYFIPEEVENGKLIHGPQIWTQGEPDEARHWFPSFDFPSDKATTEQFITANADESVIGNGEFVTKTTNADGTVTHHFRMNEPTPTYLVSFVIGQYVRVSDKYRDIPLGFFVYPGTEAIGRKAFGNTKDMMQVFESLTGVGYPFAKYDQTIVAGFTFGGMENITATTMADTEILAVNNPLFEAGVGDLVSHELAHSWFGNLVTCKNWAELWLNEGFATLMEAAFREKAYGRESYMNKIRRDAQLFIIDDAVNRNRNALFNQNADKVAELFDRPATTYNKGGAVLHMLREEIGDAAFWKGVNIYLNRHKFGSVESTDLKAAMEEASGSDLTWFFDQWVYMGGHPKISFTHAWNSATKTLRLTIVQTQKPDRLTPAAFRLPMEVAFTTGTTQTVEKLNVTKRQETFSIKLPDKPTSVVLDPADKVVLKAIMTRDPS